MIMQQFCISTCFTLTLATEMAWQTPFVGSIHKDMLEAINQMNRGPAYSTYMPIVQSSGMGKSRTTDELAKLVFTIPFNIRDGNETTSGISITYHYREDVHVNL
jgi:hypothetical protein